MLADDFLSAEILPRLSAAALTGFGATSHQYRRVVAAYKRSLSFGRRLACCELGILERKLWKQHHGHARDAELESCIEAYLWSACAKFGAAACGKTAVDLVSAWTADVVARFILANTVQMGIRWAWADEAVLWALRALGFDTVARIVYAPDPGSELFGAARAPAEQSIAHLVRGVELQRAGPKTSEKSRLTSSVMNTIVSLVTGGDPAAFEFGIAATGLLVGWSQDTPKRHMYLTGAYLSYTRNRYRAAMQASAPAKRMGLDRECEARALVDGFRCPMATRPGGGRRVSDLVAHICATGHVPPAEAILVLAAALQAFTQMADGAEPTSDTEDAE